jgi:hypothetical protein
MVAVLCRLLGDWRRGRKRSTEGCVSIGRQSAVLRRTFRNILEDVMRKTITALVATASVAAAGLAVPKPAEARCLGCWIGAGIAAAVIGGAFASRAYGYGYGYGYPAYSYGYGYPAYSYGYGYPAYSYGYGYPAYSYGYPAYGYARYAYAPVYYAPRRYYARRYYRY